MFRRLFFLLFFLIPLIEISVFILVGKWIGVTTTVLSSVVTSLLGFFLLRYEGVQTFNLVRIQLKNGQIPGRAVLEGLFVLIGGYLLIVPGFLTDLIGLICILPFTRNILLLWFLVWLERKVANKQYVTWKW